MSINELLIEYLELEANKKRAKIRRQKTSGWDRGSDTQTRTGVYGLSENAKAEVSIT